MRVFHIVSSGDAQSIPMELALHLPLPADDIRIAVFLGDKFQDPANKDNRIIALNGKSSMDRRAARRLKQAMRDYDPDIVHVHHAASSLWGTWAARLGRRTSKGAKRIILKTEHNDRNHQHLKNLLVNYLTYPLLDGVVCNSNATHHSLNRFERGCVGDNAWTIYNGVDIAHVKQALEKGSSVRAEMGIGAETFCIGTVGRMVEQKNHEALITGFASTVQTTRRPLTLILVGNGPVEAHLKALAESLNVADKVIFTGSKSRDEVYQLLGAFDAFIMPSLWEGFCNAAVEAMAAGLPIAAADLPVLQEVLGETPLFFDPHSTAAIAQALETLIASPPDLRANQGRVNQTVATRYEIGKAAGHYHALYETLLAERGEGS